MGLPPRAAFPAVGWISVSAQDTARESVASEAAIVGTVRVAAVPHVWEWAFPDVSDERGALLLVTEER